MRSRNLNQAVKRFAEDAQVGAGKGECALGRGIGNPRRPCLEAAGLARLLGREGAAPCGANSPPRVAGCAVDIAGHSRFMGYP